VVAGGETTPAPAAAVGDAVFQDSSLQAIAIDVPASETGFVYAVWLIGVDGTQLLPGVEFSDGTLSILFVEPDGDNLLAGFNELDVSVEPNPDPAPDVPGPIRYLARAPQSIVDEIRRLDDLSNNDPTSQAIVEGLRSEAQTHDSHLGFALSAIGGGNLAATKQHLEHSINVLEGEASPAYVDWNQSGGPPENPGDGFGLIPYLRLAIAMLQSELQNPDIAEDAAARLPAQMAQLEAALALAQDSSEIAQRMVAVDSIDEIRPLADEWSSMFLVPVVADPAMLIEQTGLRLWTPVMPAP
jgi:hypothetical protein